MYQSILVPIIVFTGQLRFQVFYLQFIKDFILLCNMIQWSFFAKISFKNSYVFIAMYV